MRVRGGGDRDLAGLSRWPGGPAASLQTSQSSSSSPPAGSAASDVVTDHALGVRRSPPSPSAAAAAPGDDGAAVARSRAAITAALTWTALAGPDCSCHSAAAQPCPKRCVPVCRAGTKETVSAIIQAGTKESERKEGGS